MKATEARAMTVEQLNEKLASLKKDLFFLRMQHATNQLDNRARCASSLSGLPEKSPFRKERAF